MGESFRIWLESANSGDKRYVFTDLDETLIHGLEVGWLKDCPGNDNYAAVLVHGRHPHPDVVDIAWEGKKVHIFPRPYLKDWLVECNKFATVCLLTHSKQDRALKCLKALKLTKYFHAIYSTRDLEPNELGEKYNLTNKKWVLIDNMKRDTVEMINKLRILGMSSNEKDPKKEGQHILKNSADHFVNIKGWYPTVDDSEDYHLMRVLPEIKKKLGLPVSS